MREGLDVVRPKVLVIPQASQFVGADEQTLISGQICISGHTLMIWLGDWQYISGSNAYSVMQTL